MIPVLDRFLSHLADCETMAKGIPSLKLMERAGTKIAEGILPLISPEDKILILCGSGGNGGDGYVIGRLLLEKGYDVSCLAVLNPRNESCQVNRSRYQGPMVDKIDSSYSVIIDGLFGTGLDKDIRSLPLDVLKEASATKARKYAIDVPSGLDSTTGKTLGFLFPADFVFTIQFLKLGFFLADIPLEKIAVLDIGILLPEEGTPYFLLDEAEALPLSLGDATSIPMESLLAEGENPLSALEAKATSQKCCRFENDNYRFLSDGLHVYMKRRE